MPYQSETDAEFRFLWELLGDCRGGTELGAEARICQACGETAKIPSLEHRIAALEHGGDFIAFWDEHAVCRTRRGLVTGWRFCEVCRCTTSAFQGNRTGNWWICRACREGLRLAHKGEAVVLGVLARWRGAKHGSYPGRFRALPENVPCKDDVPIRAALPDTWVPIGIRECPACRWGTGLTFVAGNGGEATERVARCRCEIPRCRICRERTALGVPMTVSYSFNQRAWLYTSAVVASFTGYCRDCLNAKGVKTSTHRDAQEKLDSEIRVRIEKLKDKWTVEDVRRERGK